MDTEEQQKEEDVDSTPDDGLDDFCAICGGRGLLLACDTCSSVFHLKCQGLKAVPEGDWSCQRCMGPALELESRRKALEATLTRTLTRTRTLTLTLTLTLT